MALEIDLSGRSALITGGGNGIGAEIGRAMVRAGAHVWINDINAERAAAVAAELTAIGPGRASPVKAEALSTPKQI